MSKKKENIAVKAQKYRLSKFERYFKIKLDGPEKCLEILEKILVKGWVVSRSNVWQVIDRRYNDIILKIPFSSGRYVGLKKRYDRICERAEEINDPIRLKIYEGKGLDKSYRDEVRLGLKLAIKV